MTVSNGSRSKNTARALNREVITCRDQQSKPCGIHIMLACLRRSRQSPACCDDNVEKCSSGVELRRVNWYFLVWRMRPAKLLLQGIDPVSTDTCNSVFSDGTVFAVRTIPLHLSNATR